MTGFQSWKDIKKEDRLNYADVHYHALIKLFDLRCDKDLSEYERSITGMDILLHGFKDDQYISDLSMLNAQKRLQGEKDGETESLNKWFFDEKAKILSSLIYRCNKERPRIREFVTQSEIVKEIARKLLSGLGQNCFITGKTGSGKSHTALHMCWELSKITATPFSLDNLVFTPQEFARIYNDTEKTPEGSFIIFDEAGIGYGSRNWYDDPNKLFSELMQIIRHRKIAVFFTAPDLNFIDSVGRKLLHWWFETEKLDKKNGVCYIKPHTVEVQQATGKVLYPFPVYNLSQYSELRVGTLPQDIIDQYEAKAAKYKNDIANDIEIKLAVASAKTDLDPDAKEYVKLRRTGMNRNSSMAKLSISSSKATRLERIYKAVDSITVRNKITEKVNEKSKSDELKPTD